MASGRHQQVHDPGLGFGHGFEIGHGWCLLREAVSDGFDVVCLSHHRLRKPGRRGIDESRDGHGRRLYGSEKIEIWGLERHVESVDIVQEVVLDVKTCDGAHVALGGTRSPVSVGHRLGSASLSAHLFASFCGIPSANLWADGCHNKGHTGHVFLEVEEVRAGGDIDGRKTCCCGLEKDHDGCRVEICCRRREIGSANSFQLLTGEMRKKVLESWNRAVRLGCSRTG